MYKAIFRVDGSNEIGIGHIASEINIARKLKGFDLLFISKYDEGIKKIKEFGYNVEKIPKNLSTTDEITLISKINDKFKSDVIIVDLLRDDYENYCKKISGLGKVLVVDYFGGIEINSDVLLNWSIFKEDFLYKKKNPNTIFCLGPKYLLCREEIGKYHDLDKKIKENVKNVLITIGGSDRHNLTPRIIDTLKNFKQIEFNVVVGGAAKNKDEVEYELKKNKLNYNMIDNCNDLSELMYKADLAISAGGITCLELAAIGTPSLCFSTSVWETKRLKKLEDLGISVYAGNKDNFINKKLCGDFKNLIQNQNLRKKMSKNGKNLIDGRGINRIIKVIKKLVENGN